VLNPETVALVQAIVRRESLSMLSYIGDAFPWTTSRGVPALARLQELVVSHREAVGEIGRFLTRKRTPVGFIGSYPTSFTTINFLSLDYMLPRLVNDEKRGIAELELDLQQIADEETKQQVEKLLKTKRATLEALELLAFENPRNQAS
jgi:hypothetical protein